MWTEEWTSCHQNYSPGDERLLLHWLSFVSSTYPGQCPNTPRYRWVVRLTLRPIYSRRKSPQYPLDRILCEPQKRSGCLWEERNLCHAGTGSRVFPVKTEAHPLWCMVWIHTDQDRNRYRPRAVAFDIHSRWRTYWPTEQVSICPWTSFSTNIQENIATTLSNEASSSISKSFHLLLLLLLLLLLIIIIITTTTIPSQFILHKLERFSLNNENKISYSKP